ncbi:hypothetical protein T01_638 [Trichinella spiralis]|uniref:Uncharacterized protein n=2 Tax=Trichinella spiralis TaxID=6334 RepID=A0A0V1AU40_TRISP|nr:hypothetical protein T01_638 [Trichinella spiralis]
MLLSCFNKTIIHKLKESAIIILICGGVFCLRQCFCYGVFLSDSLYFDNMRDNKDQMRVSVIRSVSIFGQNALVNLRPSVDRSTAFGLENSLKTNIKCQTLDLIFIHYYFLE